MWGMGQTMQTPHVIIYFSSMHAIVTLYQQDVLILTYAADTSFNVPPGSNLKVKKEREIR